MEVYSLENGGSFLGLSVGEFSVGAKKQNNTIYGINFKGIYAGKNKDIVDKMLVDLSEQNGSLQINNDDLYIYYTWGDLSKGPYTYVFISEPLKTFEFGLNFANTN